MSKEERICVRFFLSNKDGDIYTHLKDIPERYRTWEAKKILVENFRKQKSLGVESKNEKKRSVNGVISEF